MITIKDVASFAEVSVATVSRVLNNMGTVAPETKERVLKAINDLHYQPNLLARHLRRSETRMILVLLPNISNPFYARLVKGMEDVGQKNGYSIMLCNTDSDQSRERTYLEFLHNHLSDGVIFMAPELPREELSVIGKNFPVVQCCEYKEGASVSHVSIDNLGAAYRAVNHLLDLGHRRIAIISSDNRFVSTIQREIGYRKALEEAGIKADEELIRHGDYSFNSGFEVAKQFIGIKDRPTAIFAISDIMAIGAMKAVRTSGLKIPDDIAVVGFDNISFSSMCDPMLTTISQPKYDLGCVTMELLIKQIQGEVKEPRDILLESKLIIRESTVS